MGWTNPQVVARAETELEWKQAAAGLAAMYVANENLKPGAIRAFSFHNLPAMDSRAM